MNNVFKLIFRRQNIIALLIIVSSILGAFGLPEKLGLTFNQIVFALLALLTIDNLTERLGYLERIEQKVIKLGLQDDRVEAQDLLYTSAERPEYLKTVMQHARELCFAGRSLVSIIDNVDFYKELATRNKCRFRFLLADVDEIPEHLMYAEAYKGHLLSNTKKTISLITDLRKSTNPKSIEVRFVKRVPTLGLTIIDGAKPTGRIKVQIYSYSLLAPARPQFDIFPADKYYRIFLQHFEELWEIAVPYNFDDTKQW